MIVVDVIGWASQRPCWSPTPSSSVPPETVSGRRYLALDLVGSAGLTVSGAGPAAWPSAVLNLLWLGLALHAYRARGGSRRSGVVTSATPE